MEKNIMNILIIMCIIFLLICCYDIYVYSKKYVLAKNPKIVLKQGSRYIEYDYNGSHYSHITYSYTVLGMNNIYCSQNNPLDYTISFLHPLLNCAITTVSFAFGIIFVYYRFILNDNSLDNIAKEFSETSQEIDRNKKFFGIR